MGTMKPRRYPEGVMTEREWVERHAERIEAATISWYSLIDRRKHFRLGGEELAAYERSLQEKAKKPEYRAWSGDGFHVISAATYDWAKANVFKEVA